MVAVPDEIRSEPLSKALAERYLAYALSTITQRALPDVLGFGVITETPGFTRSSQSLMPFGLPLRTRNTMVDV